MTILDRTTRRDVPHGERVMDAQSIAKRQGLVNALRAERFNESFDDVRAAAHPALRHRILLNFDAEADNITADRIVADVLAKVETQAKVA